MTHRNRLAGALLVVTVSAAMALAGCSSAPAGPTNAPAGPTSAPAASSEHDPADVTFAQNMIPHHQQAITMSDQATARGASPAVKTLADRIRAEQGPEIDRMTAMLTAWGAPTGGMPAAGGMPGMGMMSDQDMHRLDTLSGPEFDRSFLQLMISHHQGAVDMAHTEQAQGQNPQAKGLADSIITGQQAEIDEMRAMLQHT